MQEPTEFLFLSLETIFVVVVFYFYFKILFIFLKKFGVDSLICSLVLSTSNQHPGQEKKV